MILIEELERLYRFAELEMSFENQIPVQKSEAGFDLGEDLHTGSVSACAAGTESRDGSPEAGRRTCHQRTSLPLLDQIF